METGLLKESIYASNALFLIKMPVLESSFKLYSEHGNLLF